ncbi:DNA polymerase II [Psychromonas sp. B3M02]|uniref:DNA polymerase II n=1 Tax=Psychromonas sp. B3M02 TaxID=2267226 RepID=UPI000DEAC395|nr:DNA polymerase II [Psychromonas sp. B3M02]RBW47525.1 DNA polymerase II [Psychromonas sp. B3M02]
MSETSITSLSGLILSRQQVETTQGVDLIFWLTTERGPCRIVIPQQRYVFLIEQAQLEQAESIWKQENCFPDFIRPIDLKTFNGQKVCAIYTFKQQLHKWCQLALMQQGIATYEGDIKLSDRFLMERFIYGVVKVSGQIDWLGSYWSCQHATVSSETDAEVIEANGHVTMVSLDVECSPQSELYSIALSMGNVGDAENAHHTVLMIGRPQAADDINVQWVKDERALLLALIHWFEQHDPDAIIGWAVANFDMRLLAKRAQILSVPLTIGRDGSALKWLTHRDNPDSGSVILNGRVVLDGIDALKNASLHFESYSLEFVSQSLFGEGKLIANNSDKGLEIKRQFEQEPLTLARYNLQDCLLVERIFEDKQLAEYTIQRARLTGLALERRGASVAAFINLYLPLLHRSGYIAPNLGDVQAQHSPGGFVMDSRPGLYEWVLVLDFKSLYPNIMRSFKIDPLGMVEGLLAPEDETIPGFRGARFSRTAHHLPKIINTLTAAREQAKKDKNHAFQHAIKIIMNSMYGVLGSAGCRFHDTRLASSITLRGHQIMQDTAQFIEAQGQQVIYGDTDSTFVYLKSCQDQQQAMQAGKLLAKDINHYWETRLREEFDLDCFLEIEFETAFSKFFMPTLRGQDTGSKKRYAGLTMTDKGEEIVFKGLETVRSDWTELAQNFQKALYQKIFAGLPVETYIMDTIEQLKQGQLDDKLVYHKRLRRPLADYVKNVPPQVKAARLADQQNAALGLPLRYQQRGRIGYLLTVNGPEPQEYLHSDIDYQQYIDKQLKPIAEAILPVLGKDFNLITSDQMSLF